MLREIVVFLTPDYTINKSIWVEQNLTKDQITKKVNEKFKVWYYYDIIDNNQRKAQLSKIN